MRAMTLARYGTPDVFHLGTMPSPEPKAGEVLVRIHATAATPSDCAMRLGRPLVIRLFAGLRRPKASILGDVFAGEVVAVGPGATKFRPGDAVYGTAAPGTGTYAELLCLSENGPIARKPDGLSFSEAAGISDGVVTALPFLRDHGRVGPGQRVLVNGASGAIGSIAVQLAKHFGAEVTGVCSTRNVDLVRSLGADHVIDYTTTDFTAARNAYDVIFDAVGKSSFARAGRALKPGGRYLTTVPTFGAVAQGLRTRLFGSRRAVFAMTGLRSGPAKAADLHFANGLIEAGQLRAVTDRTYPLSRLAEAHAYVETGHKRGSVVIAVP
ncbi:MAG: NAD(P)-dependent alcohol dehydrogenase [Bauldia sp.]|nr:NAD(P)-dependent alcohol dehydrogenase [Bauldia sp.]